MLTARDNAVLLHAPGCDPQPVAYCNSAADARLFAAAPDLLEALESYVAADFEMHGTTSAAEAHNARLQQARAAIRKAKGGGMSDTIQAKLRAAATALKAAGAAIRDDLRTSGTACEDYIAVALSGATDAHRWYSELLDAERRDAKAPAPKPQPKPQAVCHICYGTISDDDLAVCGGCDEPTCPKCMADDGICDACVQEEA